MYPQGGQGYPQPQQQYQQQQYAAPQQQTQYVPQQQYQPQQYQQSYTQQQQYAQPQQQQTQYVPQQQQYAQPQQQYQQQYAQSQNAPYSISLQVATQPQQYQQSYPQQQQQQYVPQQQQYVQQQSQVVVAPPAQTTVVAQPAQQVVVAPTSVVVFGQPGSFGTFGIRGQKSGHFLHSNEHGSASASDSPQPWEINFLSGDRAGKVSLKSQYGMYLCATSILTIVGGVTADRTTLNSWERWNYEQTPDGSHFYLKSFHGRYLSMGCSGSLSARNTTPDDSCSFLFVGAPPGGWPPRVEVVHHHHKIPTPVLTPSASISFSSTSGISTRAGCTTRIKTCPPKKSRCTNDTLSNNAQLKGGKSIKSQNGKYHAVMQSDGNLVVYVGDDWRSQNAIWASNTHGKGTGPYRLVMQDDGNLVIYDMHSKPTWASNTHHKGSKPFRLVMQNDRNLVVYDVHNKATWASGTNI